MDSGKASIWLKVAANLGLLAGLVFVALEIRTNTETNLISIFQASSANWMEINGDLMDRDVAELLEKAFSDEELDDVERRQFEGWVRKQLTHAAFIRRLYNAELISDAEFRNEFANGIREYREIDRFRQRINSLVDEEFRKLILDDGGLDSWLDDVD